MAITYRADKGSPLTNAEVDANFAQLANGSIEGFLQSSGTARSWISKGRDIVSVKDFLAVGDGVTDDSQAFIDADDEDIGDIYVPDGTYIVEGITLTGKKMLGPGTIKWKAASSVNLLTLSGRAVLDGIKFDGNAANQSGTTIAIVTDTAPYAEIKGCYFTNFRYKVIVTDVAASPYGKITGNTFEDNGTVGSCSQAELRSPYWIVQGNHFEDIGDGHCIRVGLFSGDATGTPVTGTVVNGNIFKDTEHVGVTLELYAQRTTITGNTFDTLEQAIKCEAGTGDVFDAVVTGNTIKNISATTALALNVPGVVFTGNSCFTLAGPCNLGDNAVCSGNFFDTCGTASTQVAISQASSCEGATVTGNTIINSPFRAISIAGGKATVTGNFIFNTADAAIRTSAEDTVIVGNVVDTALVGIAATSAAGRYAIRDNILTTCTTTISVIDNATSATSFVGENVGYVGATYAYTLASGAFTVSTSAKDVSVDTESAAGADDLDTIDGGYIGQIIAVRGVSAARVVTVKDGTGNLLTAGDFVLDATADTLLLMYDGINWRQIGGSNNA
jgi:hypothetical protein